LAERGVEKPGRHHFFDRTRCGCPAQCGESIQELLRQGQTIVFDIYPCEAGGGYFYDLTRTWCLGYAPDGPSNYMKTCWLSFRQILSEMQPGGFYPHYHSRACDLFEEMGHPTLRANPRSTDGFCSRAWDHGVGLNIHERPRMEITQPRMTASAPVRWSH